ncbi:hypothetical protein [Actimicrobium sp. CCI2.3]|uniref:hypothetical protein n=1 Tax=Actimicrobium sp. CCI2.3 TaxID=3048616 RepID=UPI002AB4F527|nr:hypothetical protein [Actimicrobium sp. CCI2.3]MDY7572739.1 hypothetical protein [Actimicrobium sp. CCI2.3]MEB0022259.1 hypothetical protein [Actimicrobium sp. CCI2.3]
MSILSKIDHMFQSIGTAIHDVASSIGGVLKAVLDTTKALANAIKDHNFTAMATSLASLGLQFATLPASCVEAGTMSAVQETMKMAGDTLGCADKPWMHKVMDAVGSASTFAELANPADALAGEAMAAATGQPSPLASAFQQAKNVV